MFIKYRFKNDLYVGSNTVNLAQLLRQNVNNRLSVTSGSDYNIDKHVVLFDKSRANVGAVFLTFNISVDGEMMSNLIGRVQDASLSGSSPGPSRCVIGSLTLFV